MSGLYLPDTNIEILARTKTGSRKYFDEILICSLYLSRFFGGFRHELLGKYNNVRKVNFFSFLLFSLPISRILIFSLLCFAIQFIIENRNNFHGINLLFQKKIIFFAAFPLRFLSSSAYYHTKNVYPHQAS